jgi:competence protein ComEC
VRSCVGAVLVLGALALGREPLSLRMLAVGAIFVLLLWPESLAGPSFELSFAAVIAIIALHASAPARAFLAPREEAWLTRIGRNAAMLLLTGFVIEIALMPIVLFHFHRAGIYGAFANVVVIPLVTFASMPLIALALTLDLVGLGGPAWWLAGKSLELMLWIAHLAAAQPGAVRLMPQMGWGTFALFVAGGLWLALWRGKARLWGFVPAALATGLLLATPTPDLLIAGDGRNVAIAAPDGRLLMSRSRYQVDAAILARACARADVVVSDRWLPRTCLPKRLKADGKLLAQTGGLSVVLGDPPRVATVASSEGEHGWWDGRPGR